MTMSRDAGRRGASGAHGGRVAIVTGGGRGIGRAVALDLARQGAAVVVNDVGASLDGDGTDPDVASQVVAEIQGAGGRAVAHLGSVTDTDAVEDLVRTAVGGLGGLDIVVNVAGIMRKGTILDVSPTDWATTIDVHLTGTFNVCRCAAPVMADRGWGRVVNVTSHSAFGFEGQPAYAAAKAGIIGLTLAMATELAGSNVTCNAIAPAASTRMSESSRHEFENMLAKGLIDEAVWHRFLSLPPPECTSPVVSYLASDAASTITGLIFATGFGVSALTMASETSMHTKDGGVPFDLDELAAIVPAVAREARDGEGVLGALPS